MSIETWTSFAYVPLLYFFALPQILVWVIYYMAHVLKDEKLLPALWYAASALLSVSMIFFASTRGTILGLVGGLLVAGAIFAFSGNAHPRIRKAGIGLLVGVLVVALGFFALKNTEFIQNNSVLQRIANISSNTLEPRLTIWTEMALPGFL